MVVMGSPPPVFVNNLNSVIKWDIGLIPVAVEIHIVPAEYLHTASPQFTVASGVQCADVARHHRLMEGHAIHSGVDQLADHCILVLAPPHDIDALCL